MKRKESEGRRKDKRVLVSATNRCFSYRDGKPAALHLQGWEVVEGQGNRRKEPEQARRE